MTSGALDRGEVLGDACLEHAEGYGPAERDPAVVLLDPAHRRPRDGGQVAPGSADARQARQQRVDVGEFGCPPSGSANVVEPLRHADEGRARRRRRMRTPVSTPATSSAALRRRGGGRRRRRRVLTRRHGRRRWRTRTGRAGPASAVLAWIASSRSAHQGADVGTAAGATGQRRGDDVAHPFVAGDGSRPASAMASASAAGSVMPRIWTLPRDVSSIVGGTEAVGDGRQRRQSGPPSIIPPGSRIRASAPSAA